jgi:hypothetical protein
MLKFKAPIARLNQIISAGLHDSETINVSVLEELGIYILRNAFPVNKINNYYQHYLNYKNAPNFDRTKFHLTEVKISNDNELKKILKENEFLDIAQNFFSGNVGLYNFRIVKKDIEDTSSVFLHQDVGYHIGNFDRFSLFVALTPCGIANGGLKLYPGTHKLGYLGDVGEINDFLPDNYPRLVPDILPGDVIVMHSAVWHSSGANKIKSDRVYFDIHIQAADEPSTKEVLLGSKSSEWILNMDSDELFNSSRTQKLKAFYQKNS